MSDSVTRLDLEAIERQIAFMEASAERHERRAQDALAEENDGMVRLHRAVADAVASHARALRAALRSSAGADEGKDAGGEDGR